MLNSLEFNGGESKGYIDLGWCLSKLYIQDFAYVCTYNTLYTYVMYKVKAGRQSDFHYLQFMRKDFSLCTFIVNLVSPEGLTKFTINVNNTNHDITTE